MAISWVPFDTWAAMTPAERAQFERNIHPATVGVDLNSTPPRNPNLGECEEYEGEEYHDERERTFIRRSNDGRR